MVYIITEVLLIVFILAALNLLVLNVFVAAKNYFSENRVLYKYHVIMIFGYRNKLQCKPKIYRTNI